MENTPRKDTGSSGGIRLGRWHIEHWHIVAFFLILFDALSVNVSYLTALLLRFELRYSIIPAGYLRTFFRFAPVYTVLCIILFWTLRLYKSIWRFASYSELVRVILATAISALFQVIGTLILIRSPGMEHVLYYSRMPYSYYIIGAGIQLLLVLGIRFSYRLVLLMSRRTGKNVGRNVPHIMVIGAGNAGQMIQRDIKLAAELRGRVCCFIDDNPNKKGRFIDGVPVAGNRDDILAAVARYRIDKIYVAIPSASAQDRRDILNICKETGCELKNLPGVFQLVNGEVSVSQMRDVAIEDLLGRDPITVDMTEIFRFLTGKTILVTGGGGSIGSEICRQVAKHEPRMLIIIDIYENNAYEIQQELRRDYPQLDLKVLIASVRDSRRIEQIFARYRPEVVFHAAAHKHVPLMEDSPDEAIKNNVLGTYKTAYAAMRSGCRRFVLISTDKAVNPTNIMGASKRMCEMVIQSFDQKIKTHRERELPALFTHFEEGAIFPEGSGDDAISEGFRADTEFVAVRFGNVLGSNGSVIPLFKKQIAAGGPVTVTHPEIIRYFMTIPEAVSLVLQAGTYARGGEIFVLDMGAPVKIDTLARNLIKLSGFKPDVDIRIEYTGLRPGEKLYEEKLMAEEGLRTTPNRLIHIGNPIPLDVDFFLHELSSLMDAAYENDDEIRKKVQGMVSTYHPAGRHGSEDKGTAYQEQIKQMHA